MSRKKRLESYRKRMRQLEGRIRVAQIELDELKKKATFLHAELAVEAMPEWQRTALVSSAMSTNLAPRPIVMNEGSYEY
jgi:hypothetical protein